MLRHHVEDDAGLIGRALVDRGYELTTVMIDDNHAAPTEFDADVVVVLGSNCSVYDDAVRTRWLDGEFEFLRTVDRAGVPIFGICFGAQVLCAIFGGEVRKAEIGEIGWTQIDVSRTFKLGAGPWFEYHGDCCILSERAQVWATTPHAVQAFSIGRHVGVQFHPEVDGEQLARWFASTSPEPRAHNEHETALLEETRRQTPDAIVRARDLVDLFLSHAFSSSS